MTTQKIHVNSSFFKRKNTRCGTIFDGPDTSTILRFDYNFSGNVRMCFLQLHLHYDRKQNHAIAQNEIPRGY